MKLDVKLGRRSVLRALLLLVGGGVLRPGTAAGQGPGRPAPADAAHRIQVDVPILADDPAAVPLTISVEHPMDPDHYIKSLEVVLATDPVPQKGVFLFTPESGRASVAYQMRSGQGGEMAIVAECSRHGRFEARQSVRVAPGGCAIPAGAATREGGGAPSVRTDGRVRPGQVIPVWATLKHTSHTGLVERQGKFVQERPPYFVERLTVFLGDQRVSEFRLTPAVSPDPKLRFFVKADPGKALRIVFVNNRGERWEASQQIT
ncbi:MAG TPA: thiosulfate oxidation carrier protein SoxY [Methylomirabilota bacterium]|jgi:sulfur-oxidizing protein SoxY|nr:thiosulfate oxidation carrier protein SoxY [Methylomirabilota bacterium]